LRKKCQREKDQLNMGTTNRNRNLKISKGLLKSKAHRGTSLFTSAAMNQREFPKGGQEKLRSDFQSRLPEELYYWKLL